MLAFSNWILDDIPAIRATDEKTGCARRCLNSQLYVLTCLLVIVPSTTWHVNMNMQMQHLPGRIMTHHVIFSISKVETFLPKTKQFPLTSLIPARLKRATAGINKTRITIRHNHHLSTPTTCSVMYK